MKLTALFVLLFTFSLIFRANCQQNYAIVIHGGAGVMSKEGMGIERQGEYKAKLEESLLAGERILKSGGTAVDAVIEAIKVLEDSPLFNAGKGAVFTSNGRNELDASIMEGKGLNAGAVAGVTNIKNPIVAAREVMERSEHVLLSSDGASAFAKKRGLEMVNSKYFFTNERYELLKQLKKREREQTPADKTGTVGCVVLDSYGNLCAGTSTGGMTNKKYGRIGDSPIIGAGNYASNETCAVSCTGHGEYFIRLGVAKEISALVEYKNMTVEEACQEAIIKLERLGGTGGMIALDVKGNIAMEFNTSGMFRGYIKSSGEKKIAIFADE